MTMPDTNSFTTRKAYIEAWGTYCKEKMDAGWEGYLITLMFKHIPGSEAAKLRVMEQELCRVYATLLTRLFHRPNAPRNRDKLPIIVAAPDYPVAKQEKHLLGEVRVNDGLHLHGVALFHPERRLKGSIHDHFDENLQFYIHGEHPLLRLHLARIETRTRYVVAYGYKTVQRRAAIGVDGFVILPRTSGEMR
ncbi:hypothetical protein MKK67_02990 [Methylobacterium sp. J-072]|uniref:hypothetical protein n=1 Tax=Methylobacterium sp. J-072 TaxID=2836651 RepID=UPI001FBAC130|nr:hypothetical protein [Methylobacterium sp. J-072]MCJ2091478.1 hypothetical protein [Methylobacterium sp. J-072]